MSEEPKYFNFLGLEFPVYIKAVLQYAIIIWLVLLTILLISQYFFNYEMTTADIPGGLVSGFLLAYLTTLIVK